MKAVEWYPLQEYKTYYEECKKGFELLIQVYDDNTTIHHTLSHYISIVEGQNQQTVPDTNPIIDTLKDMWSKEEIKAINELLNLIKTNKNRDIYLKSLEDIAANESVRKSFWTGLFGGSLFGYLRRLYQFPKTGGYQFASIAIVFALGFSSNNIMEKSTNKCSTKNFFISNKPSGK